MSSQDREVRLQVMLQTEELEAIHNWRFQKRMPSRASAIRELLRRGLAAEGFESAEVGRKSSNYGLMDAAADTPRLTNGTGR